MAESDVDPEFAIKTTVEMTADFYYEVNKDLEQTVSDIISTAVAFYLLHSPHEDQEESFDELTKILKGALKDAVETSLD